MRDGLRVGLLLWMGASAIALAGPYSTGQNDPDNPFDAPVPGFVGPAGDGVVHADNRVNPLFLSWGAEVIAYERSDSDLDFGNPALALGPVTGDHFKVVSLGELSATDLDEGKDPGFITMRLGEPLRRLPGADLVVFENAFLFSQDNYFIELAYVEVSSDGENFVRFPSHYLREDPVATPWSGQNPRKIFNLAGKHRNAYGQSWGTPFDLNDLLGDSLVMSGLVDLENIRYVRIVDIPGRGDFADAEGNPIYDPWPTFGSGGFDLEAIGGISVSVPFAVWFADQEIGQSWAALSPEAQRQARLDYALAVPDGFSGPRRPEVIRVNEGEEEGVAFRWVRDLRHDDLEWAVQISSDLTGWTTVLQSSAGGRDWHWMNGAEEDWQLTDQSLASIRSIGVVREYLLRSVSNEERAGQQFFRLILSPREEG